jgi:hypothetical protein
MPGHNLPTGYPHHLSVRIPIDTVAKLGFSHDAVVRESEVLAFFPLDQMIWLSSGNRTRPTRDGWLVEEISWDFAASNVTESLACFEQLFRKRAFPSRTRVTRVSKDAEGAFTFEDLIVWDGDGLRLPSSTES